MSEQVMKVGGTEVHVEGTGPDTIVMVHGWPDTHRLWDGQVAALKDRYRCIRFTLPGFDPSTERRERTLEELIGTLKNVIEQLSPGRKVILMLHDWGCVFGYQFYARNPNLVSKIVGVDIGDSKSLALSITPREKFLVLAYQYWLALAWKIGGSLGDRMTRYMARRARCPSDPGPGSSRMDYPYFMLWFGGKRSYRGQILAFNPTCPLLFIYARRKAFMLHAQSWMDEMSRRPGNQVVEFDTGHWVMLAQPERFNQVVGDWLARTA